MEDNYSKEKWTRIGLQKRAGLVVPLFSVYSKNSLGIGDLKDLRLVIDFCKKSGNSILQLLPMNEVGQIFCPYDSMSSFALEPMYISIEGLLKKESLLVDRIKTVKDSFPLFNKSYVDYRIKPVKLVLLKDIFAEEGRKDLKLVYKFQKANSYWIDDFVLFKALKDYHSGRPWYEWEEPFKLRDRNALNKFIEENSEKINFELWLQWQLHKQFKEAKCYAEDNKVLLKGDLPIFVSRDSADVWAHPEFFKLDFAAGAPPDMYCARGQRWGMPTYNWERIELNNFTYLKEKLKYAQEFYDILRVDHVVGLFRVWSIPYNEPLENQGLNGFFDPIDESMWENHGKKILAVILNNTRMLICAEDLGVIPRSCPKTLEILGIPGNDVQRWVKDWQNRHDFLEPGEYRRLSVAMLSTHDTTNWPAWWENEAGTVDETLFKRLCMQHGIDFEHVCKRLFDSSLSRHGRLRWLNSICSWMCWHGS